MNIAIITGASSGLGKEFAKQICDDIKDIEMIWAIARNSEQLNKLKNELPIEVKTIPLDLSVNESINIISNLLSEQNPNVKFLINNAGFGKFCSYENLPVSQSVNMIDLNCKAVVSLSLAVLPYMQNGSKIINTASAASFNPLPYAAIYSSSKAFVLYYSRALNRELKKRNITVTALCPYWVKTEFFKRAHDHSGENIITKYEVMYEPEFIVKKALKAATKGKDIVVPGFINKLQQIGIKLLPQRLVMNLWQRRQNLK